MRCLFSLDVRATAKSDERGIHIWIASDFMNRNYVDSVYLFPIFYFDILFKANLDFPFIINESIQHTVKINVGPRSFASNVLSVKNI